MFLETDFGRYSVTPIKNNYASNGNLAIELVDNNDGEPFATLTVNVMRLLKNEAALDTNNCPWAEKFVTNNRLAEKTGRYVDSGFCRYPVYKFRQEELDRMKG